MAKSPALTPENFNYIIELAGKNKDPELMAFISSCRVELNVLKNENVNLKASNERLENIIDRFVEKL